VPQRMSLERRRGRGILLLSGCAAVVLVLLTIHVPGTIVLTGTWILGAALNRAVPGLSRVVSLAAAIVVEVTLLVALSAALAFVSPHPHGALPYLAILSLPAILGLTVILV
jgi:hypothetical protein